jgi:DNA-binding response OmpR family regulator
MQRVLVMSDDAGELSWLRNEPSLQNYDIETVVENAEVLKLLRRRDFDVVVTNPRMPVKGALTLLVEMRRIRSGLRLILLAPETTPEDVIEAMRAHVFACFSAPYNVSEVVTMINRAAVEERDWKDGIEVLSATSNWIALRVTPRRLTAERLVRFMTELSSDLPDTEREELITAFREVLLNAMEHGAGFNPELVVDVSAIRTQRAIVYYFRDPGTGFDPENLPHAAVSNIPENPLEHLQYRETHGMRPGGFGIMVTKQLVDEVIYNEICNEVLLIKHTS